MISHVLNEFWLWWCTKRCCQSQCLCVCVCVRTLTTEPMDVTKWCQWGDRMLKCPTQEVHERSGVFFIKKLRTWHPAACVIRQQNFLQPTLNVNYFTQKVILAKCLQVFAARDLWDLFFIWFASYSCRNVHFPGTHFRRIEAGIMTWPIRFCTALYNSRESCGERGQKGIICSILTVLLL